MGNSMYIFDRELSKAELKRRERIAKDLPDAEFKKRYGKDWKSVKIATATKLAKKNEIQADTESNQDTKVYSYSSTFVPQINITVVFKEYEKYDELKPLFKEYGYGFYAPESKTIIINGEEFINSNLTFNDLKFVEAHEVSHLILNHSGPLSDKD